MLTFQRKTNGGVVERFFVEPLHLELPAMMLFVAIKTMFPAQRSVKALFPIDACLDLAVTGKAITVRDRFTDRMALRAIVHSLKMRMRGGQFTGRKLSRRHLS